jgi:hypothetical protein
MSGFEPVTQEGQVLALLKECVTMKLTGPTPIEEFPDHLAKAMTADTVVVYGMAANMIGILIQGIAGAGNTDPLTVWQALLAGRPES